MNSVKIYNARDEMEANQIISALELENIPCCMMQAGSGDWMKMTQGFSVYGIDLYVDERDAAYARTIIETTVREIEDVDLTNDAFDELIEEGLATIEDVDGDGTLNENEGISDSEWENAISQNKKRLSIYKNKPVYARVYLGICVAIILYMIYLGIRY